MKIFVQDMVQQERLLLSLLIVTGMRIDEAALLTWEQYQEIDGKATTATGQAVNPII